MTPAFIFLAALTLLSAVAAMSLRNLVHCALALAVTFSGIAAFYLQLDAQFLGFAQVLVYIGAVAIVIVVAILLTPGGGKPARAAFSPSWIFGIACACAVFALMGAVVLRSRAVPDESPTAPTVSVRQIGDQLMTQCVVPLEALGL